MKPNDLPVNTDEAHAQASPEIFHRLGALTRQLHDTLNQLGVMPKLRDSVQNIPDARERLNFIAHKTGEAAEKVLNLVELAKAEHEHISAETRRIAGSVMADPVKAVASGEIMNFVEDVDACTARINRHLTEIMIAQDYHDLTSQVISKVVTLAQNLEEQLLDMLVITAPGQTPPRSEAPLQGPVATAHQRIDTVSNQSEVDDLLASMGF